MPIDTTIFAIHNMVGHYPPNYMTLMEKLIAQHDAGEKAAMTEAMQPYSDAIKATTRQELIWFFKIRQTRSGNAKA
jgi:hypothetical protein